MKKYIFCLVLLFTLFGCKEQEILTGVFTDSRDGETYKTIKIGDQVWMAENLNYNAEGSWVYDNNISNSNIYGRLYNWETACKICPKGWHLPNKEEWEKLIEYLGGDLLDKSSFVGGYLKEVGTNHWESPNKSASNRSGFTALPGGHGGSYNEFYAKGTFAHFITSSADTSWWLSWCVVLNYQDANIEFSPQSKVDGYSIRCIKD